MSKPDNEGYNVVPITHKDLDDALDKQCERLEKILDLKISPVEKAVDGHHRTLYGISGANGLTGKVKVITIIGAAIGTLCIGLFIGFANKHLF